MTMILSEMISSRKKAFNEADLYRMSEDKTVNKKHWKHKPYQCDFRGGSKHDRYN